MWLVLKESKRYNLYNLCKHHILWAPAKIFHDISTKNHFVYKLVVFCCASYADDAAQVQRLASGTRGIATIAPMKSYDRARAKVGLAVILWPGHRFNVV
jgi:hypothetical protein